MKLNKEENLKLMRSCAQVRVIELTEKMLKLANHQKNLLNASPDLKKYINALYINENPSDEEKEPSIDKIVRTHLVSLKDIVDDISSAENTRKATLPRYDTDEKTFERDLKTYSYRNDKIEYLTDAINEYEHLIDKLMSSKEKPLNSQEIKELLDTTNTKHTQSFSNFAEAMRSHSALFLSVRFKDLLNSIATRNNFVDKDYTTKADNVFDSHITKVQLRVDSRRRFTKLKYRAAFVSLAALLATGGIALHNLRNTRVDPEPTPTPQVTTSPTPTPNLDGDEDIQIFSNSIKHIETYEDACNDCFEKISDVYRYETGQEWDLSGYTQKQIGYNPSARVLFVEYNGQNFIFSGISSTPSNYENLVKSIKSIGAKVEEGNAALCWIIDKNNPTKSVAISFCTDDINNYKDDFIPIRSGNVLNTENEAYLSYMVEAGGKLLEEEGKTNATTEEKVGRYLVSDLHKGDKGKSKALELCSKLFRQIKETFFKRGPLYDQEDKGAVNAYIRKANKFEEQYENNAKDQKLIDSITSQTTSKEADDQERE